jgi:hypothetical protein
LEPILKWATASYAPNYSTSAPKKILFGSLFQIMPFKDSFWF